MVSNGCRWSSSPAAERKGTRKMGKRLSRAQEEAVAWEPEKPNLGSCQCGSLQCHGDRNCSRVATVAIPSGTPRLADGAVCAECGERLDRYLPVPATVMGKKVSRVDALVGRDDQRWGYLCAMVREADRREGVYGALYDQGWQDAMAHMVKIMFPWSDGTEHAEILNEVMKQVERERA